MLLLILSQGIPEPLYKSKFSAPRFPFYYLSSRCGRENIQNIMESKLVEYARAVVEDAVDVDADFFQKFRDAMSFRAIMQSQHPYIIGVAISDILKKRVFSRRSTFLFNSDDIVKSISVTGELCGYAFYAFSKVIALERDEFSDVVRDALLAASGSEAFNRDKASLNEEVAAAKRLLILLRVYEEYLAAVLFDYRDELIRRLVDEEGKIIVESSITQEDIDNIIYNTLDLRSKQEMR